MEQKLPTSRFPGIRLTAAILFFLVATSLSSAHQAISGWQYPLDCCNEFDCRQLSTSEVNVGPGYYIWKNKHISFFSPKIRPSPDTYFHACENAHWGDTSGKLEITCFFVPTTG